MVSYRTGRLCVSSILTFIGLLEAAPQKRSCHVFTSTELDTSSKIPALVSNDSPIHATSTVFQDAVNTQTSVTIRESIPPNPENVSPTPTPKVILIYPNTTLTLPPSISISISINIPSSLALPTTTLATFNCPSSHSPSTSISSISTNPTFTTPDIQAMQTAYYLNVCSWPEHANGAICLGDNSMLCCQASNPHCRGVLTDGGLDCQGIESGEWATTWVRPTVTLGSGATTNVSGGTTTTFGDAGGSTSQRLNVSSDPVITLTTSTVATAGLRAVATASTDDASNTTSTSTTAPTSITAVTVETATSSPTSSFPIIKIIPVDGP